ncbi:unnamed protein product [Urochloa humidicola]
MPMPKAGGGGEASTEEDVLAEAEASSSSTRTTRSGRRTRPSSTASAPPTCSTCPAPIVRWFPDYAEPPGKDRSLQKMGARASDDGPNDLMRAQVQRPLNDA